MIRHLTNQHLEEWNKVKEKALEQQQPSVTSFFPSPKIAKIEKYKVNSERRKKINKKLAAFIAKDMRPISIVKGVGFRELMSEMDSKYTLPTVATLRDKLIPNLHAKTTNALKDKLESIEDIAITTDGWTNGIADKYNAYTCHYIDWTKDTPVLETNILECAPFEAEKGDAEELKKEMQRVTDYFGITEKVVLSVADNAKDVQKSLKLFGGPKIGCAAHKINLSANLTIWANLVLRSKTSGQFLIA